MNRLNSSGSSGCGLGLRGILPAIGIVWIDKRSGLPWRRHCVAATDRVWINKALRLSRRCHGITPAEWIWVDEGRRLARRCNGVATIVWVLRSLGVCALNSGTSIWQPIRKPASSCDASSQKYGSRRTACGLPEDSGSRWRSGMLMLKQLPAPPAPMHDTVWREATLEDAAFGELFKAPPLPAEWLAQRKSGQRQPGQCQRHFQTLVFGISLLAFKSRGHTRHHVLERDLRFVEGVGISSNQFLQDFPKRAVQRVVSAARACIALRRP